MINEEIKEWLKTIIISIILAWLIVTFIARPTIVRQESMYPTLHPNDYLMIEKITYRFSEPKRGDIIVFESPMEEENGKSLNLIKRVIGEPGDHIVIENDKTFINGEEINQDYVKTGFITDYVDIVVPEDAVFVMGDNRPISLDSRDSRIGPIETDRIMGKVLVRLFPFNKIGKVK